MELATAQWTASINLLLVYCLIGGTSQSFAFIHQQFAYTVISLHEIHLIGVIFLWNSCWAYQPPEGYLLPAFANWELSIT